MKKLFRYAYVVGRKNKKSPETFPGFGNLEPGYYATRKEAEQAAEMYWKWYGMKKTRSHGFWKVKVCVL